MPDSRNYREIKPYREADRPVSTENKIKPLPPQGHLVDDTIQSGVKYFFKDIGYDMKSVKNGYIGVANDHQLGRLNDVGLRLCGIGIATYLASQTTNPKARLMEYIGLAAFLTSMAVYPKIAVNAPARMLHGYDIDKQYIDDQGRKKSVHQDSNYIPYDMYNGKNKGEDLDAIGDRMGIPRDIKNRHDVIREQMRKIATQNNTLWMLTAGFATPLMTALLCSGIEKFVVSPGLEDSRNRRYNSQIQKMMKQANVGVSDFSKSTNSLGDSVKHIVSKYDGKIIPKEEIERITELFVQDTDLIMSDGIKADLQELLSGKKSVKIDNKILGEMFEKAGNSMKGAKTDFIFENILPSSEEIEQMIKSIKPDGDISKGIELSQEEFGLLKKQILEKANGKIENVSGAAAKHKDYLKSNVSKFYNAFSTESSPVLTKDTTEKIIKFANIMGEFKKKSAVLDKCENFKFEYTNETILANYYEKFQKTLIKQLNISPKDFKRMSNDKEFTQKILDEKISELCKDKNKYEQTFEKLGKVLADMEKALHGADENNSQIKKLITEIENVYNSTAKSLADNKLGENTVNKLVKGDYTNSAIGNESIYDILDGIVEHKSEYGNPNDVNALKEAAKGKGSSKNIKIGRLIERYQGEADSFYRVLHTLDFYNRAKNPDELMKYSSVKDINYINKLEMNIKDALMKGSISDYILKLGTENKYEYRDLYNVGWSAAEEYGKTSQKGIITDSAKKALEKNKTGNIAERFQKYITKFRNIISNDITDFTRPGHILDENITKIYKDSAKNNEAKFNLVGQSPIEMIQKGAGKVHADRMWLKSVGILTGAVFGITLLAQFSFGKLNNKDNLQKINNTAAKKQKQV